MGGSKQAYDCMRSIANALRDKFCTPFYDVDYPVGVQNTLDWINGLGALLGEEETAKQIAQVRGDHNCGMTQEVEAFVESYKKYLAEVGKKKGAKAA